MAQSSKSRIVIWTIVGILVVVAAVMFIKKPKEATVSGPAVTPGRIQALESRLQKFQNKVDQARSEFPGAPAEKWQQLTDITAKGRQALTDMQAMTEQKDLKVKLAEYQKDMIEAKRLLKEITGRTDEEPPAGE
jgi:tRNA U34 5-carboxymethylaminomethyl modifying GTPase MnmE/TrmE